MSAEILTLRQIAAQEARVERAQLNPPDEPSDDEPTRQYTALQIARHQTAQRKADKE